MLPYRYQRFGWNRLQKPLIVECPGGRVTFTRELHGTVRVDFANGEGTWTHPGALRVRVPYHPGPVHYANEPDRDAHLCRGTEDGPPVCTPGLCDSCDAKRLAAHEALEECYATAAAMASPDFEEVELTAEQYEDWDGTPEHLAAILDRPELAHADLGDEAAHLPDGRRSITVRAPEDEAELTRKAALNRGQP